MQFFFFYLAWIFGISMILMMMIMCINYKCTIEFFFHLFLSIYSLHIQILCYFAWLIPISYCCCCCCWIIRLFFARTLCPGPVSDSGNTNTEKEKKNDKLHITYTHTQDKSMMKIIFFWLNFFHSFILFFFVYWNRNFISFQSFFLHFRAMKWNRK